MKTISRGHFARVAALALAVIGCVSDSPTAPPTKPIPAAPDAAFLSSFTPKRALKWNWEYTKDITVSKDIDARGGTLSIGTSGFTLIVPKGAVKTKTRFSVTATKGWLVAFEFQPHGLTFDVPLIAKQDLDKAQWSSNMDLSAGYFADRSLLLQDLGYALVSETVPGVTNVHRNEFQFPIKHFSGYIIAW